MAPTSPTVAQWEYSLRLKQRREELGLSVQEVADQLGFSRNFLSAVENERAVLADDKFDALAGLFEFEHEERDELHVLRDKTRGRPDWLDLPNVDAEMTRFYGLEQGATEIKSFESLVVPGLLQTDEYARAFIGSDPMFNQVGVERLVKFRMDRQRRLGTDEPLQFTALLSEAVLYQHVGSSEIQRRQIRHLANIMRSSSHSVQIRVLPFSATPGPLIGSSTLLFMQFSSRYLPVVAWQEAIRPLGIIEEAEQLRRLQLCYEWGLEHSLDSTRTYELLERIDASMG